MKHLPCMSNDSKTLWNLLVRQAELHPDRTALICRAKQLSMRELAIEARKFSVFLQREGAERGHCIALYAQHSLDLMIGVWGILSAGCAYLPVSPEYPRERVCYMIEHSRSRIIFCEQHLYDEAKALAPSGVRVVTIADAIAESSGEIVRPNYKHPTPDDLAYVIYTSGSTGKPKGVMIEHKSIVHQMQWLQATYGLDEKSIILQKTPASFDAAQWEILAPVCGATVVMGTPGIQRDVQEIIQLIQQHRVTTLQCVPTLLQALVETDEFRDCTSLTQIFCGGEALTQQLARNCLKVLPERQLINLYGPTECTINASAHTVDCATFDTSVNTVSIGTTVDGTIFNILDSSLSPVNEGDVGELFIGGVLVGRGYLNESELTKERFIDAPLGVKEKCRLYKTGDLVRRGSDGVFYFVGRVDNQVKLRGHRIELDEIRSSIESFEWIKHAGVILKTVSEKCQRLIAYVELNGKKAPVMDQGLDEAHHRSKSCRSQVRAQLANPGCRESVELAGKLSFDLSGVVPTRKQREKVFARKTYRFYEGGPVCKSDILTLLASNDQSSQSRAVGDMSVAEFGEIVRYLGRFTSEQRLLPKYAYASPGALYATQIYFELNGFGSLPSGYYYYHPLDHRLFLMHELPAEQKTRIVLHLVGKRRAIQPVYKKNIREVLEIEAGHIVGLLENVLPQYGLSIHDCSSVPSMMSKISVSLDDYYLGAFEFSAGNATPIENAFEIYVQAHPGKIADLPAGLYQYNSGGLDLVANDLIRKHDTIAINQGVYDRASFGITIVSRTKNSARSYVDLGRKLQRFQMNEQGLGFMSSGYSSKSGCDLPSATRISEILRLIGQKEGPSYFFVGGRVSSEQRESEGMKEDAVHMKGPAEMLQDSLSEKLPDFMVPHRVVILDKMPLTANGKIDMVSLRELEIESNERPALKTETTLGKELCKLWSAVLGQNVEDVQSDFFDIGGNSIDAVELVHRINAKLGTSLSLQTLHEAPTILQLEQRICDTSAKLASRLINLGGKQVGQQIFIWPGLGGSPTSLRPLARQLGEEMWGIQALGLNSGETPLRSLQSMAAKDVELIRSVSPSGPYRLWGYSFGARVAFETAFQLEQMGKQVKELVLIAPGAPKVVTGTMGTQVHGAAFGCPVFVSVLYSVFAGGLDEPRRTQCVKTTQDKESFAAFIKENFPKVRPDFADWVVDLVTLTYAFQYTSAELLERRVRAPITVFRTQGDDASFIDLSAACAATAPEWIDLMAGHYAVLRKPLAINELIQQLQQYIRKGGEQSCHTSISNISQYRSVRSKETTSFQLLQRRWPLLSVAIRR